MKNVVKLGLYKHQFKPLGITRCFFKILLSFKCWNPGTQIKIKIIFGFEIQVWFTMEYNTHKLLMKSFSFSLCITARSAPYCWQNDLAPSKVSKLKLFLKQLFSNRSQRPSRHFASVNKRSHDLVFKIILKKSRLTRFRSCSCWRWWCGVSLSIQLTDEFTFSLASINIPMTNTVDNHAESRSSIINFGILKVDHKWMTLLSSS